MFALILLADFGLGLMIGEPSGINGKLWDKTKNQAIETGISWSIINDSLFVIGGWNKTLWKKSYSDFNLNLYPGIGAFLGVSKDLYLGLNVPLGADLFLKIPLNISLEIYPGLLLIPKTEFKLFGFFGLRYVFDSPDL